ncbi:hypothetical protein [Streptomyces sp. UNOB3_S3]|uniref:TolB family protein n=1 Tax=Streptomyces sp. UNOB3_S3 TaxID=2871682 RepID=UPI001E464A81|nr:hypothetical protein [Streptomyces sp. UNOB3_S3]MCC3775072.1 hypothetical protein [Streptomyces sp. UNOB3_S3]
MRHLRHAAVVAVLLGMCATALPTAAGADERRPRTEQVSTTANGTPANAYVEGGSISADGRYVTFTSRASNLVPGATDNHEKVFVKDLRTGGIELISTTVDGRPATDDSSSNSISGDGRYVVFSSYATDLTDERRTGARKSDVFVRDRRTGRTEILVKSADTSDFAYSLTGEISDDGRYVAFVSNRKDLVQDGDSRTDVYLRDRLQKTTRRVSVKSDGSRTPWGTFLSPTISADGSKVGFRTNADLTDTPTARPKAGIGRDPYRDFYVHDMRTGRTQPAAHTLDGTPVRASWPSFSPDGRYLLFSADEPNMVEGDTHNVTDAYAEDLATGETRRVSTGQDGELADAGSYSGALMSADHRKVFFSSRATNLVPDDTNHSDDVFVRDLGTDTVERVSLDDDGAQRPDITLLRGIDRSGDSVLFSGQSALPTPGNPYPVTGLFVRHLS